MLVEILATLCYFGTVYVFTVPLYYLVFTNEKEERKYALKVLGILILIWYGIRFLEKGVLDNIMQYNTVPNVGRWSLINSSNSLVNVEFHNPYPSFPSGHMLLGVSTGLTLLKFYNSLNTKILIVLSICVSACIKMYMNMHSIYDICFTILIVVSVYYILLKAYMKIGGE